MSTRAWFADGSSLYNCFNFEWTLLTLGPQPPTTAHLEQSAQAMRLGLKEVRHTNRNSLALQEAPLVLIRPDQILAWHGHDAHQAQAILLQVLG